jgi:hypothetical protein
MQMKRIEATIQATKIGAVTEAINDGNYSSNQNWCSN